MVMFRFYFIIFAFLFSLTASANETGSASANEVESARDKTGSASANEVDSARISEIDLSRLIKGLEDRPSSIGVFDGSYAPVLREIRDRKINIREYPVLLYKVMEIVALSTNYYVYTVARGLLDHGVARFKDKTLLKDLDGGEKESLFKALNELLNSPSELDPAVQARLLLFVGGLPGKELYDRFDLYRAISADYTINDQQRMQKLDAIREGLDINEVKQLAIQIVQKKEPAELFDMLAEQALSHLDGKFTSSWLRASIVMMALSLPREFVGLQFMKRLLSASTDPKERGNILENFKSLIKKHGKLPFNDSVQSVILPALVENDMEVRAMARDVLYGNFISLTFFENEPLRLALDYRPADKLGDSKIFILQHLIAQEEEHFKFLKSKPPVTPPVEYSPSPKMQSLVWRILALALSDRDSNVREQAVALFNVKSTAVSLLVSSFKEELSKFVFDFKDVSGSSYSSAALMILEFDRSPPRSFSQRCYRAFKSAVGLN